MHQVKVSSMTHLANRHHLHSSGTVIELSKLGFGYGNLNLITATVLQHKDADLDE